MSDQNVSEEVLDNLPEQPPELIEAVESAKDAAAVKEIGIEWCIQQSKELKANNVPCLHYYMMGDSKTIKRIVEAIF